MKYRSTPYRETRKLDLSRIKLSALLCVSFLSLSLGAQAQTVTPANTEITNIATATFVAGNPVSVDAEVSFNTDTNSPSAISFLRIDTLGGIGTPMTIPTASCSLGGDLAGPFTDFPLVDLTGESVIGDELNAAQPSAFATGEPILLQVIDTDQNLDGSLAETLSVTITTSSGDSEIVQLIETGDSTAEFVGAIQSADSAVSINNCILEASSNSELTVVYTDADDATDTVSADVLIDPFGIVFDSSSGLPIDGVVVTLIDEATNLPATVFSPNGIDIWPSTVITGENVIDSAGNIFTTGPGEYRFPLVVSANYRLEVVPNTDFAFPSVVSDGDLQLLPGAPFALTDASRGGVFFVPPGPPVQIDVPLDPFGQALTLIKTASQTVASVGDFIAYDVTATNSLESAALNDIELVDLLPFGFRFQADSLRVNGEEFAPIISGDGRTLTIPVESLAAGQTAEIRYVVEITGSAPEGEAINQVQSVNPAQASNIATASIEVESDLFSDNSFLTGRMIIGQCGATGSDLAGLPDVRLYLSDGRYVDSDSEGRWQVPDLIPGTHVIRIDETTISDGYQLSECRDNTRKAGAINSRFVELEGGTLWVEDFYFELVDGAEEGSELRSIEEETLELLRVSDSIDQMPDYDESWLADAEYGSGVLWPADNFVARQQAIRIAVKHDATLKVKAYLNGDEVSPLNFRGRITHPAKPEAVSTWKGVDIGDGTTVLKVDLVNKSGSIVETFERNIHFSGAPFRAEFVPELSRLVADGQTPPLIAVQLTDKEGNAVRPGVSGPFLVANPHEAWQPESQRLEQVLVSESSENPTYVVNDDGIAYLAIAPTNVSGRVRVTVPLQDRREEEFDVWLTAEARDWILVGLAEGGVGYGTIEDNMQDLDALDLVDGFETDGKLSFFAKGRILGDFLLTLSYDSTKETPDETAEVLERIDPEEYYTVYGDESELLNETPSSEKLYLKIEKNQFYALFGDYQTDLSVSDLSRYTRVLTGIKSEFRTKYFEANLFASDIALANVRDEIQGNGTSGRFFLSNTDIVENSEIISIQVRDRFQTGEILSETSLSRFRDYEINYDAGYIDFANPISSRDEAFNPIFIIANYETTSEEEASVTGGGRVAFSTASDNAEIGASYIREGTAGTEGDLVGVDSRFQITEDVEIKAEVAASDSELEGSANAWSVEATQQSGSISSQVFARRIDDGFGLDQQNASDQGTQRVGAGVSWQANDNFEVEAIVNDNREIDGDNVVQQANVGVRYDHSLFTTQIGYRIARDEIDGQEGESDLATSTLTVRPFNRLNLSAAAEVAISGNNDSAVFPERYTLGAEYLVTDKSSLFVEQEYTNGGNDTESTRFGVRSALWRDSQVSLGLSRSLFDDSSDLTTTAGFVQRFQISESWTGDVTIDRGQTLEADSPASGLNPATPLSSGPGGDDFTASSVGADWRSDKWAWSNRLEYLDSDTITTNRYNTGILRQLDNGTSLLASLSWNDTQSNTSDSESDNLTVSVGYANRVTPAWTILNRLDLDFDNTSDSTSEIRSRNLVSNNNFNYNGWEKSQISLQYAGKYNLTNIDDSEFSGYTDLIGVQYRRDLSDKWDIGLRGATLASYNSGTRDYALGATIGWSPIRDTWLELGYNIEGFQDDDFAQSEYTAQGFSFTIRHKFDETTAKRFYNQFFVREPKAVAPAATTVKAPEVPAPVVPAPVPIPAVPVTITSTPASQTSAPESVEPEVVAAPVEAPVEAVIETPQPVVIPELETMVSFTQQVQQACKNGEEITVIQLASFLTSREALKFLEIIDEENEFIEYYHRATEEVTFYRANLGPFTEDKAELLAYVAELNEKYGINAWLKRKLCGDVRVLKLAQLADASAPIETIEQTEAPKTAEIVNIEKPETPVIAYANNDFSCEAGEQVTVISLASYVRLSNALGFLQQVDHERTFVEEFYSSTVDKNLFRVNVGPFDESTEEMRDLAEKLENRHKVKSWVKSKDCSDLRAIDH